MTVTDAQIDAARANGVVIPTIAARASEKVGVPFWVTCAFLMQESDGGHNVFGHDPAGFAGAGEVTKLKYLAYKRQRAEDGMQGVGPMQLTWWEFQDRADALGGCWKPDINVLVGLQVVRAHHVATGSWVEAARRYNGAGPAADAYAAQMAERFTFWQEVLTMPKPDPYQVIRLGTDTSGRPILVNRRMLAALDDAHARLGGRELTIVQGAYMARVGGGAAASAGYHDKGGCLDWRVWDLASKGLNVDQVIRALRTVGWAAWHRDQAHGGMDEHIHGVLLDDRDAADGARWQMSEYRAGRDGLASAGRDYHWRPSPIPTFDYQAWTKHPAEEDDMQLDEIINPGADKADQLSVREALRISANSATRIETLLKDVARQLPDRVAKAVETQAVDVPGLTKEQLAKIRDIVYAQSQRATREVLGSVDESAGRKGAARG